MLNRTPTLHQQLKAKVEHTESELIHLVHLLNCLASLTNVVAPGTSGRVDIQELSYVLQLQADKANQLIHEQNLTLAMLRDLQKENAAGQA